MKKTFFSSMVCACVLGNAMAQSALDLSFGNNGRAVLPSLASKAQWATIEVLDDGGSLLAGFVQKPNDQTDGIVMKVLANGQPDSSFGTGGLVIIDNYPKEYLRDIVLEGNETVTLVGNFVSSTTDGAFTIGLSLSGNTNSPKEIKRSLTGYNVVPTCATKDSEGLLLIGGYAYNPATNSKDFLVIKYDHFNLIDETFGHGGSIFIDNFREDRCFQIQARPDGRILLTGYSNYQDAQDVYSIVQLNQSGGLDTQFGNNGKLALHLSPSSTADRAYKSILQSDGKLVVVGNSRLSGNEVVSVVRLNTNGSYDNGFDGDGRTYLYLGLYDIAYDVKIALDGKILVAGATRQYDNTYRKVLFRLLSNGARDLSFASQGLKIGNVAISTDYYGSTYTVGLALLQDGSVLTSASQSNGTYLVNKWINNPVNSATFTFKATNILPAPVEFRPRTFESTKPECGDPVTFTPKQTSGNHLWNFGDGSTVSSLASPVHVYQQSGTFNVKHWIVNAPGDSAFYQVALKVNKFPNIGIGGDMLYPHPAPINLFYQDYYDDVLSNSYTFRWTTGSTVVSTDRTATYGFPSPGIYPYQVFVGDNLKGSSCQQVISSEIYYAAGGNECPSGEVLGNNLVVNGNFTTATCPATSFSTDVPWKCNLDGIYEEGKIAIVNDALQFSPYFLNSSSSIPGLDGNFLLVSSRGGFIFMDKTVNKTIWSQSVQVQAGKKYRFKADLAELSSLLRGDYDFSEILLVVDNNPIAMGWNDRATCAEYVATQTKSVKLSIVKAEGFRVFNGSIGVDNVVFAPILQSAPSAREDNGNSTYTNVFSLSPNPATDMLRVSFGSPGYLEIMDTYTGRILKSLVLDEANGSAQVPLEGLSSGMYAARLSNADGSVVEIRKFLVQK